ncbi:elongation factor 4 [Candidatus Kuenenbacteria bacterium]|nr:elongation factor 4 [Candidatus Kuenenbacteria bacterium]
MSVDIRNFCIIAHIDHGKSTLADRFLELTKTIDKLKMHSQFLDQMDLEREKGITIKLQPVQLDYQPPFLKKITENKLEDELTYKLQATNYKLNLIDTPGHVDFTYEVSRSLAAVEGAILLVDATQGIQAQTLANLHLALEQNLFIIPAINKIDLPNAQPEKTIEEIKQLLNYELSPTISCPPLFISAKTGEGVEQLLCSVIKYIPPPADNSNKPLRALIFDSVYDEYKGVIVYVRIVDGKIKKGDQIEFMGTKKQTEALEVGIFKPNLFQKDKLETGEIGYIATGLKDIKSCKVGDTIIKSKIKNLSRAEPRDQKSKIVEIKSLPGYKEAKPMVFAGLFCKDGSDYLKFREALDKLKLTDASLFYEPELSQALGFGFRCGFLGMLHLEIIQERLRREYGLDLIITTPSVVYKVILR